jgi:hypothetical protein
MSILKKILLFLICLLQIQNSLAVLPIKVEVKVFGKDVIFVFYRGEDQIVDLQNSNNTVIANVNIPTEFTLLNSSQFKEYANGMKSDPSKQKFIFSVDKELKYQGIINGEKLDAIKFKNEKQPEKQIENLSKLGSANNDPALISYSQNKEIHNLHFDLGDDKTRIAAFFRGKYIWVVFDQKKIFSSKNKGIFSKFEIIPSDKGSVLRLKVDDHFAHAKINKTTSGWNLSFFDKENKNWEKRNIFSPEPIEDEGGVLIRGNFKNNKIISFIDPELGDVINALPVITVGSRILSKIDSIEYSILQSIQGIAVVLYSDDVIVEKYDDAVKIISDTALPEGDSSKDNVFPISIEEYLNAPTILPYLDKNLDILDFNQQKSRLIREASFAEGKSNIFDKNLELAKFFFIHEWYHESLDALNVAKQYSYNDYENSLEAKFLAAVNHTLIGQHLAAKEIYDELLGYDDVKQIAELNIWNNYNDFCLGSGSKSIGIDGELVKLISLYSNDKYWSLVFAEMELAISANDTKLVEKLLREIRKPTSEKYPNSLKFYKAEYYKKKNQLNLAKQYYRDLTLQDHDMFNNVRAKFALTKLELQTNEIALQNGIEILEKLRYDWRGDQLEYEILMELASYYRDSKDIMNALRTYQYIQAAFNNKVSNFYITSEMAGIFNDVFLPGGIGEEMDDFTIVALFYEFKELNPIGDKGDDVIIAIAKRLVRLDLLENAADLLRHQINYRLKGMKRVINADDLAIILIMDKKPNEAILVLDETDKDNFNFSEHQYRVRLRARALINLKQYDKALSYLQDDNSNDAKIIKKEALFQGNKWEDYIKIMQSDFADTITKVDKSKSATQDILRLSIAYYLLNMQDQLVLVSEQITDKNSSLRTIIDLLISSSGSIDYRDLDKSLDIDQMQMLLDKYKNQFLDGKGE